MQIHTMSGCCRERLGEPHRETLVLMNSICVCACVGVSGEFVGCPSADV